jgi:hypothetical protein
MTSACNKKPRFECFRVLDTSFLCPKGAQFMIKDPKKGFECYQFGEFPDPYDYDIETTYVHFTDNGTDYYYPLHIFPNTPNPNATVQYTLYGKRSDFFHTKTTYFLDGTILQESGIIDDKANFKSLGVTRGRDFGLL